MLEEVLDLVLVGDEVEIGLNFLIPEWVWVVSVCEAGIEIERKQKTNPYLPLMYLQLQQMY